MSVSDTLKIDPQLIDPRRSYDLSTVSAIDESVSMVRKKWLDDVTYLMAGADSREDIMTLADMKVSYLFDQGLFKAICHRLSLPGCVSTTAGKVSWAERISEVSLDVLSQTPVGDLIFLETPRMGHGFSGSNGTMETSRMRAWPVLMKTEDFLNTEINWSGAFCSSALPLVKLRLDSIARKQAKLIQKVLLKKPRAKLHLWTLHYPLTLAQLHTLGSIQVKKLINRLGGCACRLISPQQLEGWKLDDFKRKYTQLEGLIRPGLGTAEILNYDLVFGTERFQALRTRLDSLPASIIDLLLSQECLQEIRGKDLEALITALTPEEFEGIWPFLRQRAAKWGECTDWLSITSDNQRGHLDLESMTSDEIEKVFASHYISSLEAKRRFQCLSPEQQAHYLRKAEFPMIHCMTEDQVASLDLRLLCQKQVDKLFPVFLTEDRFKDWDHTYEIGDSGMEIHYAGKEVKVSDSEDDQGQAIKTIVQKRRIDLVERGREKKLKRLLDHSIELFSREQVEAIMPRINPDIHQYVKDFWESGTREEREL